MNQCRCRTCDSRTPHSSLGLSSTAQSQFQRRHQADWQLRRCRQTYLDVYSNQQSTAINSVQQSTVYSNQQSTATVHSNQQCTAINSVQQSTVYSNSAQQSTVHKISVVYRVLSDCRIDVPSKTKNGWQFCQNGVRYDSSFYKS